MNRNNKRNNDDVRTMRGFIDEWSILSKKYRQKLNEEEDKNSESIPYDKSEQIYQNITSVCSELFGAVFKENAVIYEPIDNNVVVNGDIGGFDNAHFSFKLNDNSGNGCYIWFDNLQLNETNIRKLQIIYSVYSNWKNEMLANSDYKPTGYRK